MEDIDKIMNDNLVNGELDIVGAANQIFNEECAKAVLTGMIRGHGVDDEEMIEFDGMLLSKAAYKKAIEEEFYKSSKMDGIAPLTYDGKIIGRVHTPGGDIERMTVEITTDEGKKIIDGLLHQPPVGISSRKIGTVTEDGTVDESAEFTEFSILKNIPNKSDINSNQKYKPPYTSSLTF